MHTAVNNAHEEGKLDCQYIVDPSIRIKIFLLQYYTYMSIFYIWFFGIWYIILYNISGCASHKLINIFVFFVTIHPIWILYRTQHRFLYWWWLKYSIRYDKQDEQRNSPAFEISHHNHWYFTIICIKRSAKPRPLYLEFIWGDVFKLVIPFKRTTFA